MVTTKLFYGILLISLISCTSAVEKSNLKNKIVPKENLSIKKEVSNSFQSSEKKEDAQTKSAFSEVKRPSKTNSKNLNTVTAVSQTEEVNYLVPRGEIIPSKTTNSILIPYNKTVFINNYTSEIDTRVGCSGNNSKISFSVFNTIYHFIIEDEALKDIEFTYSLDGGLYSEDGKNPSKGTIKGNKQSDNSWKIEFDLEIKVMDGMGNEKVKKIKQVEIYKF